MYIFSQLFENVFTISLKFPEENISETSASAAKVIVFIKFYIKIYVLFVVYLCHNYVRITLKNAPNCIRNFKKVNLESIPPDPLTSPIFLKTDQIIPPP